MHVCDQGGTHITWSQQLHRGDSGARGHNSWVRLDVGDTAFGETITITASNLNAAAPVMLSWQARLGCQFGGVWVAASAQSAVNKIGCTVPASTVGDVQAVVSDLHSFIPLPLENDTSVALDVPPSGRFKMTLRESALVKAIVPAAGSPSHRSKTRSLDL